MAHMQGSKQSYIFEKILVLPVCQRSWKPNLHVHTQKRILIQDAILENLPSGTSDSAGLSYVHIAGGKRHDTKLMIIQSMGGISQMQQRRRAIGSSTHFEKYSLAGR